MNTPDSCFNNSVQEHTVRIIIDPVDLYKNN